MWCGQLPDAPAATPIVGGLHRTSGRARHVREPDHPSCRRTRSEHRDKAGRPHATLPAVHLSPPRMRGDAAAVTQAPLRCLILRRPSPASRSSSMRRSGRSTLTPARSTTPSHQRRTSHDQLASVDQQPPSQIRSILAHHGRAAAAPAAGHPPLLPADRRAALPVPAHGEVAGDLGLTQAGRLLAGRGDRASARIRRA